MSSNPPENNRRILIIDDNPAIHEDFNKILGRTRSNASALNDAEASLFGEDPSPASRSSEPTAIFEMDSAFQGKEGLELVKKAIAEGRPYAMAFVDVRMPPGWDGIETIQHIWKVDQDIQIVICTAYSDYSWEEMTANPQRMDSLLILKKPFDNIEVVQLAHALTKKWTLAKQARLSLENLDRLVAQRTKDLNLTLTHLQEEIVQRTSAQASLRVSEERFSKAFRASPFPMAIVSLSADLFEDCNDAFLKMTSQERDNVLDHTSVDFCLWVDDKTPSIIRQRLHTERSLTNIELTVLDKAGQARSTLLSGETFSLGGETYAILIWQDLSERLRLEAQLRQSQKMEAVGQLAAGVAHDFNNILTVIQGHASLSMLSKSVDERTQESLEQISVAADRAAALTRQLLAFSRKQIMQLRGLGLNEAITGLLSMLNRLIGEHIKLKTEFSQNLPPIHADHGSLEQVIMNLVVNARDAMPDGGQLIIRTEEKDITAADCRTNSEAIAGTFICLSVSDTGCGMNEETRSHIFEPFFTTKEVGKGTGMGLATVYGIVQQHNGWIDVVSEPDKGSTFRIFLPTSSHVEQPLEPKSAPSSTLPRGRETVLIVEDEENLRLLVDTILTEQGYKTFCAENGVEALKIWAKKQNEIDLLLTDIVMPEAISGLQLAERMLKTHPELKVIYTSGYSIDLIAKGYALRDGQNFLPKPYPPAKLASAVRACLDAVVPHPTTKNGQSRPLSKVTPLMANKAVKKITRSLPKPAKRPRAKSVKS